MVGEVLGVFAICVTSTRAAVTSTARHMYTSYEYEVLKFYMCYFTLRSMTIKNTLRVKKTLKLLNHVLSEVVRAGENKNDKYVCKLRFVPHKMRTTSTPHEMEFKNIFEMSFFFSGQPEYLVKHHNTIKIILAKFF